MNYKKHTVLFGILLVAIVAGNVSRFGWEGSSHSAPTISNAPQVAARYHTRNRVKQSFNRDAKPTKGNANRSTTERDADRPAIQRDTEQPAIQRDADRPTIQRNAATTEGRYLATRYHSRNRTATFFERAIGLALVSHGERTPSGKLHEAMTSDQQRFQHV